MAVCNNQSVVAVFALPDRHLFALTLVLHRPTISMGFLRPTPRSWHYFQRSLSYLSRQGIRRLTSLLAINTADLYRNSSTHLSLRSNLLPFSRDSNTVYLSCGTHSGRAPLYIIERTKKCQMVGSTVVCHILSSICVTWF
ncbi:hypothetical protein V3C99_016676 [Haemonchus contortus]